MPRDPGALATAGVAAIQDRRFGDALVAFTEAAAILPSDPSMCFGAGVAAFMLGQNDNARAWFERALARNPAYLPPAIWLGELHYRAGRMREAISTYETALKHSPGEQELELRLADWRKESDLENRFFELRAPNFSVRFERDSDEPVARRIVERLCQRAKIFSSDEKLQGALPRLARGSIEEVMSAVGRGEMRAADVVRAMYPDYKEERAAALRQQPKLESSRWFGFKRSKGVKYQAPAGGDGAKKSAKNFPQES